MRDTTSQFMGGKMEKTERKARKANNLGKEADNSSARQHFNRARSLVSSPKRLSVLSVPAARSDSFFSRLCRPPWQQRASVNQSAAWRVASLLTYLAETRMEHRFPWGAFAPHLIFSFSAPRRNLMEFESSGDGLRTQQRHTPPLKKFVRSFYYQENVIFKLHKIWILLFFIVI